ncbi:juvenile hormone acid O-methyltransferase-like [Linepithema humile]|uniref:juvenile hormone acid O-methyltransferase-like n=1 Tax=Linepithema humile TaxID=83485 RepID=UPI00351F2BCF
MVNPTDYASSDDLQRYNVSHLIDEFADDLIKMSGKCMDIGCGPGDVTKNFLLPSLDPNAVIIGTDVSQSMIEYANMTYSDEQRLGFEVLDIQTKNLPEKYVSEFDHIFSFHTLHWCKNIRQAFENIYRMLRPGGTMLTLFVASHDTFNVFELMAQDIHFASYMEDVKRCISPYFYSKNPRKEVKESLKNIGFEVSHCSHREATFSAKDSNKFLSGIMSISAFLDKMPHNLAKEFKDNYAREYMKRKIKYTSICNNQEQTFVLDVYKVLIVYARKVI